MGEATRGKNRRILIIDDNRAIHDDIRRSLPVAADSSEEDALEAELFGTSAPAKPRTDAFEIASAYQGEEGLERLRRGLAAGAPFALAFIDVRMPPGWDGIETLTHLWEEDPSLQAVICSAYWDYSWEALVERLGRTDGFLVLRKPFDIIEIRQMAYALTDKWSQHAEIIEAHRRLQRSEENNRALLHAIPDAILRLDRSGNRLDFKPWSGVAVPESEVLAEALPKRLADHVAQAIDQGAPQEVGFEWGSAGAMSQYEARIAPICRTEAVVIVRDVTSLKRAAEEDARAREQAAIIQAQADALTALSMPIIPINEHIVVMPLVGTMDAQRIQKARETLVEKVASFRARAAIVDFTGSSALDAQGTEEMMRTGRAVQLLGARLIMTGLRPATAMALVSFGADLRGIATRQTLQDGIDLAMRSL